MGIHVNFPSRMLPGVRNLNIYILCIFRLLLLSSNLSTSLGSDVDCLKAFKDSLEDPLNSLYSWNFSNASEGFICGFEGIRCWHPPSDNRIFGINLSEFAYSVRVTEKCHVFSFEVMALEIIKGEYPVPSSSMANGASLASVYVQLEEVIDKRIAHPAPTIGKILASIIDLALQCLNDIPLSRPTMRIVSNILQAMCGQD